MDVRVMYCIYDIIPKDKYSGIVPEWLCDDITVSGGRCNYLLNDSAFSRGDSFMCILYVWHSMKTDSKWYNKHFVLKNLFLDTNLTI